MKSGAIAARQFAAAYRCQGGRLVGRRRAALKARNAWRGLNGRKQDLPPPPVKPPPPSERRRWWQPHTQMNKKRSNRSWDAEEKRVLKRLVLEAERQHNVQMCTTGPFAFAVCFSLLSSPLLSSLLPSPELLLYAHCHI